MATLAAILDVAAGVLKLCNKCCKVKDKKEEDDDADPEDDATAGETSSAEGTESETESDVEKKTKTASTSKRKKRRKKRIVEYKALKQSEAAIIQSQPATVQNHFNPTFTIINHASTAQPMNQPGIQAGQNTSGASTTEQSVVEWVPSTTANAIELLDREVVGGYDIDGSDLWVIRARFKGEIIPGKFNHQYRLAFIAVDNNEQSIEVFEVCCIAPESRNRIRWIACIDGNVPKNAVAGGRKSSGETLYIGRQMHYDETRKDRKSHCPGYIQPSHRVLYITYDYKVFTYKEYEVMCLE